MYGIMVVAKDLNTYLEENPLPPPITLAEARPFVREWKIEDLAGALGEVDHGRSFERGQQLFAAASCIACHKMREVGGQIGPDLTESVKKLKRAEILRELLDPSQVIDPKFRSQVIVTSGGELVTGIIVKEDARGLHLMANPLEKCEPRVVPRDEIDEQTASAVSIMPLGLMYTLNKDEILDMIAYLESGGDPGHAVYKNK
jgi:putative heme-binding domain-containing protein